MFLHTERKIFVDRQHAEMFSKVIDPTLLMSLLTKTVNAGVLQQREDTHTGNKKVLTRTKRQKSREFQQHY